MEVSAHLGPIYARPYFPLALLGKYKTLSICLFFLKEKIERRYLMPGSGSAHIFAMVIRSSCWPPVTHQAPGLNKIISAETSQLSVPRDAKREMLASLQLWGHSAVTRQAFPSSSANPPSGGISLSCLCDAHARVKTGTSSPEEMPSI